MQYSGRGGPRGQLWLVAVSLPGPCAHYKCSVEGKRKKRRAQEKVSWLAGWLLISRKMG